MSYNDDKLDVYLRLFRDMTDEELELFLKLRDRDNYETYGKDYFENPKKDKVSAYTDEFGLRLDSIIDDKSKGRGR